MPLLLYFMYWLNRNVAEPQSLSGCSSIATTIPNNLWNVKRKTEEKALNSEFPSNVSHNWQHCHTTHAFDTDSSLVVKQTDQGNDPCTQATASKICQSDCTGWGSVSTGISLMLLSVSRPKPQDSNTFKTGIILWYVCMIVGNKVYIFDIHNIIFSTLQEDTACHPPQNVSSILSQCHA
jgi:hypothetical protein